jgi:glycine hydroxymethyltransferase
MMVDIAHIAGLVATGLHPSPVPYADFVTTTTHKTLRGPRGGMILCKEQYAKAIDKAVFPGTQGGPLEHCIAAKAVAFHEAMQPEFRQYQEQVVKNSRALARALGELGHKIVSDGTDNHMFLLDLRQSLPHVTGKEAERALVSVGITVNKNMVPFDNRSPFQTSGIRFGTPAITTRGLVEKDMILIAYLIHLTLTHLGDEWLMDNIRESVKSIVKDKPLFVWSR